MGSEDEEIDPTRYTMSINGNPLLGIPFYNTLKNYKSDGPASAAHLLRISASLANGGHLATVYLSNALSPVIPMRAIVMLRPCQVEDIIYDCCYYVVTPYIHSWRIVCQGHDAAHLRLTTCHPQIYEDKTIVKGQIIALYLICSYILTSYPCK